MLYCAAENLCFGPGRYPEPYCQNFLSVSMLLESLLKAYKFSAISRVNLLLGYIPNGVCK
jgi:hypothetical protein